MLASVIGVKKRVSFDTTKPEGAFEKWAYITTIRSIVGDGWPQSQIEEGLSDIVQPYKGVVKSAGALIFLSGPLQDLPKKDLSPALFLLGQRGR